MLQIEEDLRPDQGQEGAVAARQDGQNSRRPGETCLALNAQCPKTLTFSDNYHIYHKKTKYYSIINLKY